MKITYELRNTLLAAAKKDRDVARAALAVAEKTFNDADHTVAWAEHLVVGQELSMLQSSPSLAVPKYYPALYFFYSKSGLTKGHYIELYENGNIHCSCPGFINRATCWATKEVLNGKGASRVWTGSRAVFKNNREVALNSYLHK